MTEHPPEQELTGEDARILTDTLRMANENCERLLKEYNALLAAYEDRSAAFERAAADCVRLEGERDARESMVRQYVTSAQTYAREIAERSGRDPVDSATDALYYLRQALAALSPAEAEDEQHAHAEHLREAREVEQRQEEKHGE